MTEFLLVRDSWRQSNIYSSMGGEGKPSIFAPGNLRATASNDGYAKLVDYFQQSKYTLRYTGGLVPDVTQLLVKARASSCRLLRRTSGRGCAYYTRRYRWPS